MPVPAPITRGTYRAWRGLVLALKEDRSRGRTPVTVHVGRPGGYVASLSASSLTEASGAARSGDADRLDQALRADLVGMLLHRYRPRPGEPVMWLTRGGAVDPVEDADLAWLRAGRQAFAEAGRPFTIVLVTRSGWRDLVSGTGHEWRRLRDRRAGRSGTPSCPVRPQGS